MGLNFRYAMMPIFSIHPDGSNMQQYTEPHDHHKNVEHFITQLSDDRVVWGQYYPQLEGYGILLRAPVSWDGPDGFRQNGVLLYPPGYEEGRQYPLVLNIHGGPAGVERRARRVVALPGADRRGCERRRL